MPNFLLRAVGLGFIVVLRKLIHAKKSDLLSDYQAPKRLYKGGKTRCKKEGF